jgi:hypothetical protein
MIIFTLMSLVLTIGGVTALLRRNVFMPVRKLRNYVESSAKTDEIPEPPPHLPLDLDIIAASYYDVKMHAACKVQNSEESSSDCTRGN